MHQYIDNNEYTIIFVHVIEYTGVTIGICYRDVLQYSTIFFK